MHKRYQLVNITAQFSSSFGQLIRFPSQWFSDVVHGTIYHWIKHWTDRTLTKTKQTPNQKGWAYNSLMSTYIFFTSICLWAKLGVKPKSCANYSWCQVRVCSLNTESTRFKNCRWSGSDLKKLAPATFLSFSLDLRGNRKRWWRFCSDLKTSPIKSY